MRNKKNKRRKDEQKINTRFKERSKRELEEN